MTGRAPNASITFPNSTASSAETREPVVEKPEKTVVHGEGVQVRKCRRIGEGMQEDR